MAPGFLFSLEPMHDPSGFREAGTVPRAHLSEAGNSSRCLRQAGLPDVWGRQISQMFGAGRSSWETLPASKVCFFGPSVSELPGVPEGIRHPFTLPPAKGT